MATSSAAIVVVSEFASNTAAAQIALPVLASAARSLALDPRGPALGIPLQAAPVAPH